MRSARRILCLLAVAAVTVGPALPAAAQTKRDVKVPGTNWYWKSQKRAKTSDHVSCPDGTPVCPSHQQELESTHSEGSLPIKILRGEHEKYSAIEFDTSFIPFQGATIHSFTFTVVESQTERDRAQTVNTDGKVIEACPIEETWPSTLEGGATMMGEAPKYATSGCVKGKRERNANPPRWRFDITKIAQGWGNQPGSAYGVMLVGAKGNDPNETWQVVLRGPYRNEQSQLVGQKNVLASVSFTPKPAATGTTGTSFPSGSYSTTGTGTDPWGVGTDGFGSGTTQDAPVFPEGGGAPAAPAPPAPLGAISTAAQGEEQPGGMPAYFWLLIPVALMALSLVRHTVLEPLPGKRPDGVVALIRRHNAARFGRSVTPEASSPLARVTGTLRGTGHRIRRLARRVISGGKRR